jgi:hypothetical protein
VFEEILRDELISRGYTGSQVDALQDFTAYTPIEVRSFVDDALATFVDIPPIGESPNINPRGLNLVSLNDTITPELEPLSGRNRDIIVKSLGSENVTVSFKGDYGTIEWYRPTGMLMDRYSWSSPVDWTSTNFTATIPGLYIVHITRDPSSYCQVDIPNNPSAIIADPTQNVFEATDDWLPMNAPVYSGETNQYFYVPSGTDNFTFGADIIQADRPAYGTLTEPDGITEHNFNYSSTTNETFTLPSSGLWKLNINMNISEDHFWLANIPPLVWHDPEYLLVEEP